MTLSRLRAMSRYWEKSPPLHVLVRTFVGYEFSEPKRVDGDDGTFDEFMTAISSLNPS